MGALHKSTKRDYLARVNDLDFPKAKAARLAKQFGYDYWDGDRRICYGGYKYIEGRWTNVAEELRSVYGLGRGARILDIGCGKGYLLYELGKVLCDASIHGLDISEYAAVHAKEEVREQIVIGDACELPWPDNYFDLVLSINTLHCLPISRLQQALKEIERVSRSHKYICVESWRDEHEKANLLYWQVTCESFHDVESWKWLLKESGYTGDYSFIYFS